MQHNLLELPMRQKSVQLQMQLVRKLFKGKGSRCFRQLLLNQIRSFSPGCYSTGLAISPGLSEILSHSELIPDALTLTFIRKRYNEI